MPVGDVSAIEISLDHLEPKGPPTSKTTRSEDQATIASFLNFINGGEEVEDCKCPDVGDVHLIGTTLDVRIAIMPGHTRGYIDLHDSFHKRWRVPLLEFVRRLERLGVKDAQSVLEIYDASRNP